MTRTSRAALALGLCLAATCSPDASSAGSASSGDFIQVVDSDGREVRLEAPAVRVVSLVPSATLTLDALGARDALVARTDFDTVRWASGLPSVGGGLHPRLEAIIAVHPDLVVRFAGSQDPETPSRLDDVGVKHVAIRPDRVADVLETIRILGRLTGTDAHADSLVASIESELRAVRQSAEGRPPVRVAYVLGGSPPWVAGPGTFIDEIVDLAGGVNVFHDLGSLYAAVSPEQFLARRIDVILTAAHEGLPERLVGGALLVTVSDALELPGPSVARAAREVADILEAAARR